MTTSLRYLLVGALIVVIVGATLLLTPFGERPLTALFAVGDAETVDFATLTPPDDPNWFLVCPPGLCAAAAGVDGPVYKVSAERLRARWREVVAAQPRTKLLAEHPDGWHIGGGNALPRPRWSFRLRSTFGSQPMASRESG